MVVMVRRRIRRANGPKVFNSNANRKKRLPGNERTKNWSFVQPQISSSGWEWKKDWLLELLIIYGARPAAAPFKATESLINHKTESGGFAFLNGRCEWPAAIPWLIPSGVCLAKVVIILSCNMTAILRILQIHLVSSAFEILKCWKTRWKLEIIISSTMKRRPHLRNEILDWNVNKVILTCDRDGGEYCTTRNKRRRRGRIRRGSSSMQLRTRFPSAISVTLPRRVVVVVSEVESHNNECHKVLR